MKAGCFFPRGLTSTTKAGPYGKTLPAQKEPYLLSFCLPGAGYSSEGKRPLKAFRMPWRPILLQLGKFYSNCRRLLRTSKYGLFYFSDSSHQRETKTFFSISWSTSGWVGEREKGVLWDLSALTNCPQFLKGRHVRNRKTMISLCLQR